jgi:hypothetical protein
MEAMFQTWKSTVLKKDLHLGPIGSFYCECTQNNSAFDDSSIIVVASKLKCTSKQLHSFLHIVLFSIKSSFPFSCCVILSQVFFPHIICTSPFNKHYFHATNLKNINLKIYLNENTMFKIDYENISKLFSIFIKYSFKILLFHNIKKKKHLFNVTCFIKYICQDFWRVVFLHRSKYLTGCTIV